MTFIFRCFILLIFCKTISLQAQNNTYTQKAEYGYKGKVKKVTSYMVHVSKYQIPADTLLYFGKTTMNFTPKGDITTYFIRYNLPKYVFTSKAVFKGSGKQISYDEESTLNDSQTKTHYDFVWTKPLEYQIVATNDSLSQNRFITLNNDFSIHKVIFKGIDYTTEELATYYKENDNLDRIVYNITIVNKGETSTKEDVRVIKAVDVYNNPTVIYFYEKISSRVPKSVTFKYYEYY